MVGLHEFGYAHQLSNTVQNCCESNEKEINFVSQSSDDELLLLLLSVLVELKWDLLVEISKEASALLLSSS